MLRTMRNVFNANYGAKYNLFIELLSFFATDSFEYTFRSGKTIKCNDCQTNKNIYSLYDSHCALSLYPFTNSTVCVKY